MPARIIGSRAGKTTFPLPGESRWATGTNRCLKTGKKICCAPHEDAKKPIIFIGHSIGSQVIVHAAKEVRRPVAGAVLVAPPDVENPSIRPRHLLTFGPASRDPLPFPSVTIASRNDHFCAFEVAEEMAAAWGSLFLDAGESGHINQESGHGPWPEGLMVFSRFLKNIRSVETP